MSTAKGLEGIIVTETKITSLIDNQLSFVGYSIDDLIKYSSFEEVIYLLWYKRLPKKSELTDFKQKLFQNMELPKEIYPHLENMDLEKTHPMSILRSIISLLGAYDPADSLSYKDAQIEKALRLQARIATVITTFSRMRQGKEPVKPKEEYSYAENFLYMLKGKPVAPLEVQAFDQALILHADHELNASTFTARVCVATLSDLYSGITAAIGALKGELHGGANEQVIKMLMEIGEVDQALPYIKEKIAKKEKIMGMGHRVYKKGDPRTKYLKEMSKKLTKRTGQEKWFQISEIIEDYMKKEKDLPANVDFYSASMYHSMGIEHDLFTPIFAMSRTSGWIAHMFEQYDDNRLIRPRAKYVGPKNLDFIPISDR
ncbi:citrate synthase [Amphibacillus sp. MSJ-3]|uniref:citrate synthase n=1 Tax=Amphibacillus sp. MSJ-3 TaxID=2841505 RepID=UPI001C0ECF94|nr:citrate synthase [Amphibacillus sp. MSJ-3]MBU5593659.1 citrate synthase [Amphibacillus sp. MSJ-3]